MGKALYRKYRSKSLDEIVGQEHITAILKRAIAKDMISHAYLLTGPRGVGKTSIARILAHEINGLPYNEADTHVDIIELDAASNNGVEDVRELREKVRIAPVQARRKVYIIDEVHMLSKSAFNALLKTLEEPPEHAVFVLATTDADKLPATIISRVQRFNFRSISIDDAARHLRTIADAEQISIDDDALMLVAKRGKGSFRDSISLLDQLQCLTDGKITVSDIEQMIGIASGEDISRLFSAYERDDLVTIVQIINRLENASTPPTSIAEQLIHELAMTLHERPHLAQLLDRLTEVARSPWPYAKLLFALTPSHRHSPEITMTPVIEPIPSVRIDPSIDTSPPSKPVPLSTKKATAPVTPPKIDLPPIKPAGAPKSPPTALSDFSWQTLLDEIKGKEVGLHTLLCKSQHAIENGVLTIYSGRAFSKKKIDAAMPSLVAALASLGFADLEVIVQPTGKPPEDSNAAAILDMMGGGEVVDP